MMTEAEKIEPAVMPAAASVAEAPAVVTTPVAATPAEAKPAPAPAARGGKPKKKPGGGGPGGMPNRRMIDDVPMLRDHSLAPKLNDIDAEIAGELEAAMSEINQTDMIAGNTSREDRQEASGPRKKGKILAIHGPDVFIDVPGGRGQGVMQLLQFGEEVPKIGDEIEFNIVGFDGANGVLLLARQWAATQADWSSIAEGMIVEARVLASNKGGLTVDVNGIKGFLPISQIDLYRVEQTDQFINQKFDVIVTEADVSEKNLVVSRRALLEKQREENREKLWLTLELNQIHEGIVRNVKDFGAFIDIGGIDGFLHVSEISWQRQQSAATLLQPGQKVKVAIVKLDKETRKVSVSLKQLEGNPWDDVQNRFPIGSVINGTVTRTAEFGAFVELEPGIEGLVHVSELAGKRVWRVADVAKEGQEVTVKVLSIDSENRRISLSIRQAIPRVEVKSEEDEGDEETVEPKPDRPRNFELRGGLGGPSQLFEEKE